jgi:LuxR family maltose regulon positive regulatory protein
MQQLLGQASAREIAPDYVANLVSAFPGGELLATTSIPQSLVEPLSERETAILRLMAANLSHREIAEELHLSVNTVKWYSTHIYSKLGVHRRADAVSRGRELGIL